MSVTQAVQDILAETSFTYIGLIKSPRILNHDRMSRSTLLLVSNTAKFLLQLPHILLVVEALGRIRELVLTAAAVWGLFFPNRALSFLLHWF